MVSIFAWLSGTHSDLEFVYTADVRAPRSHLLSGNYAMCVVTGDLPAHSASSIGQ